MFDFDITDPVSAKGAMVPKPYGAGPNYSPARASKSISRPPTAQAQPEYPLAEEDIERIGRTNIDMFGGAQAGAPGARTVGLAKEGTLLPPDFRMAPEILKNFGYDLPFVNTWSEGTREHVGNAFGLLGNIIDAGARGASAIPLPGYEEGRNKFLDRMDQGDPITQNLRKQINADPAQASRYIAEAIERDRYEIADMLAAEAPFGWTDPLMLEALAPPENLQEGLWNFLSAFMGGQMAFTRLYTESGHRDIQGSILDAPKEELPGHILAIRERYESGDLSIEDLPSELALNGASFTNDPMHNLMLELLTDPANIAMGAGLAKNIATGGARAAFSVSASGAFKLQRGAKAFDELKSLTKSRIVEDATKAGRPIPSPTRLRTMGEDALEHLETLERNVISGGKKFYDDHLATQPLHRKATVRLAPALDAAAYVSRRLTDPLEIFFGRGAAPKMMRAYSSQSVTAGLVHSYGAPNVGALRSVFKNANGNDDQFARLLGRAAANIESAVHKESLIRATVNSGVAPDDTVSPTLATRRMSEATSNRLELQAEAKTDLVRSQYVSGDRAGKKANLEALERQKETARATLRELLGPGNDDAIERFLKNPTDERLGLVEHLRYAQVIEDFASARQAGQARFASALKGAEARLQTRIGDAGGRETKGVVRARKSVQKFRNQLSLAPRYAIIGPRELTHQRADDLVKNTLRNEQLSDMEKVTRIREAIGKYDNLYDNFVARGVSDADLLGEMEMHLTQAMKADSLVKEVTTKEGLGNVPQELRTWRLNEESFARKSGLGEGGGYRLGVMPNDDALWRATYGGPAGDKLLGINPWVDVVTESAADYNVGRFRQGMQAVTRPIRGQKLAEDAKRGFRAIATDAGIARGDADALFSVIRGEATRRNLMPRGLTADEVWQVAQGVMRNEAQQETLRRIGQSNLHRLIVKAFEGQLASVGVANKISGRLKSMDLPIVGTQPSKYINVIAERFYPTLRFRYNPVFQLQETVEPFFWNILRGVKPGVKWSAQDIETMHSLRSVGLISEFEDQLEYSSAMLVGNQAMQQAFGTHTKIGRLWGKQIDSGRRVRSIAELKRLNYVRQIGKSNGDYLKQSLDSLDTSIWPILQIEAGLATKRYGIGRFAFTRDVIDNNHIANYYHLNKGIFAPDDPTIQTFLMDATKSDALGKQSAIRTSIIASHMGYNSTDALRAAIKDGTLTETAFNRSMTDLSAAPEYTSRAWSVLNAQSAPEFWLSFRGVVRDAVTGGDVKAADDMTKNARLMTKAQARRKGLTEEEYLTTKFAGPVEYLEHSGLLPPGAKFQLATTGGTDAHPIAWGRALRPPDDERVLRVTEPFRNEIDEGMHPDPTLNDPLGGVPPDHPDAAVVAPRGGKEVTVDGDVIHRTGTRGSDEMKEEAVNVLGEDGMLRAATEADYIPSLVLRITEEMPDDTLRRLFPDEDWDDAWTRELAEEEMSRRLLAGYYRMVNVEDYDLSNAVTAMMGLADAQAGRPDMVARELENLLGYRELPPRRMQPEPQHLAEYRDNYDEIYGFAKTDRTEYLERLNIAPETSLDELPDERLYQMLIGEEDIPGSTMQVGETELWRDSGNLRSTLSGDSPMATNRQMRAFGYTDEVAMDELDVATRTNRPDPLFAGEDGTPRYPRAPRMDPTEQAEDYGVLGMATRTADTKIGVFSEPVGDAKVQAGRRAFAESPEDLAGLSIRSLRSDPALAREQMTEAWSSWTNTTVGDIERMTDNEVEMLLLDEAQRVVGTKRLWGNRRGIRQRMDLEGVPMVRREAQVIDPEETKRVRAEGGYAAPAVLGEQQYQHMSRTYMRVADQWNAETYLGKSDWTSAQVAAIDQRRYTQATTSGAAWDINDATGRTAAAIQFEMTPALDSPHASIFPTSLDEMVPNEVGALGQVERSLATWWGPELEKVSGVKVQSITVAPEPVMKDMLTPEHAAEAKYLDEMGLADPEEGFETMPRPSLGQRTTMVVTGTREQVERAVLATGGVFQRDSVTAVSVLPRISDQTLESAGPGTRQVVAGADAKQYRRPYDPGTSGARRSSPQDIGPAAREKMRGLGMSEDEIDNALGPIDEMGGSMDPTQGKTNELGYDPLHLSSEAQIRNQLSDAFSAPKDVPAGWAYNDTVDFVIRATDDAEDTFNALFEDLTGILDGDWSEQDFGRMVFKDEEGNLVVRIMHGEPKGFYPTADYYNPDILKTLQKHENVEMRAGVVNEFTGDVPADKYATASGRADRIEMTRDKTRKALGQGEQTDDVRAAGREAVLRDEDPWARELDARGASDAARQVRDRYRGEATQQADQAFRQYAPKSYENKRAVGGDTPAPLRDWHFASGPSGVRGAVAFDAENRARMFLLKGADATTVLHELFHVYMPDMDPSMKNHLLRLYAQEKGLNVNRVMGAGWSNRAEDWVADSFASYVRTGNAPDPATQRAYDGFGQYVNDVVGKDKDIVSDELAGILDKFMGMDRPPGTMFHSDEHRMWNAARQAMAAAEDEAFTTHYFRRGRNFVERSINHPYLGMYPASYMWGKALPELIRFMVAKPFGVDAPLWGLSAAINVWEGFTTMLNSDPELQTYLADNWKETMRMVQMMVPGSPVELPVQAPSAARIPMQTLFKNSFGEGDDSTYDVAETFGRSAGFSFNPLTALQTGLDIKDEFADAITGDPEDELSELTFGTL